MKFRSRQHLLSLFPKPCALLFLLLSISFSSGEISTGGGAGSIVASIGNVEQKYGGINADAAFEKEGNERRSQASKEILQLIQHLAADAAGGEGSGAGSNSTADSESSKVNTLEGFSFTLSDEKCNNDPKEFSGDTTSYTVKCDFKQESVTVSFKAKYAVLDASLKPLQSLNVKMSDDMQSKTIKVCEDASKSKTCKDVELVFFRNAPSDPHLTGLAFTHSKGDMEPAFSPDVLNYTVHLYAGEDVTVYAKAKAVYYVDYQQPTAESGGVSSSVVFKYRPPYDAGTNDTIHVWAMDESRQKMAKYTIEVKTVPSQNPKIEKITCDHARLDPEYMPSSYAYYVFIPKGTPSITCTFDAVNQRDTKLFVLHGDKEPEPIGAGSATHTMDSPKNGTSIVVIKALAADPNFEAHYILILAGESGGGTNLFSLNLSHGEKLSPTFKPTRYQYKVDLGEDDKYLTFNTKARNPNAHISIDGEEVKNNSSPFFKFHLGEAKVLHIKVTAPDNVIPSLYSITVTRRSPWYQSKKWNALITHSIADTALLTAASSAATLIRASKFIQFLSLTNHMDNQHESWYQFASGFDRYNFMFPGMTTAVPGSPKQPEGNSSAGAPPATNGTAAAALYMAPVERRVYSTIAASFPTHLVDRMHSDFNKVVDRTAAAVRPTGLDKEFDYRALVADLLHDEWVERIAAAAHKGGAVHPRVLEKDSEDEKVKFMEKADRARRNAEKLGGYVTSISITTSILLFAGLVYLPLWFLYLKGESAMKLRQDYPIVLHPAVFWTFLLDMALVGYSMSTAGIMFLDSSTKVEFMGMTWTASSLMILSVVMLVLYPFGFTIATGVALKMMRPDIAFTALLSRFTDRSCTEVKAHRRFLSWIPIFGKLFTMEIKGVCPIKTPGSEEDESGGSINLPPRPPAGGPWNVGDPDKVPVEEGGVKGAECQFLDQEQYEQIQTDQQELQFDKATDSMLVDLDQNEYAEKQYEIANANVYAKYPRATIGYTNFNMKNAYDQPLQVRSEVRILNLIPLMEMVERYTCWVPVDQLQLRWVDSFHQLFGTSRRDMWYAYPVDRATTALMCLMVGGLAGAPWTPLTWMIISAVFVGLLVPSAIGTGSARWNSYMLQEAENMKKIKVFEAEMAAERSRIWPFVSEEVYQRFQYVKNAKEAAKCCGGACAPAPPPPGSLATGQSKPEILKSRAWFVAQECISGPVATESIKMLILFGLFMGNGDMNFYSGSFTLISNTILAFLGTVLINWDCAPMMMNWALAYNKELWIWSKVIFRQIGEWLKRFPDCIPACSACVGNGCKAAGRVLRIFETEESVDDVLLVVNEAGMLLKGKVGKSEENEFKFKNLSASAKQRWTLRKHMYKASPVMAPRYDLDTCLPVCLPFTDFFNGDGADMRKLAATIHIVNHPSSRSNFTSSFTSEDDSYLSLYTDNAIFPDGGKVATPAMCHGSKVTYDHVNQQMIVLNPALLKDEQYRVATRRGETVVAGEDLMPAYVEPAQTSSKENRITDAYCKSSGRMLVEVPGNLPVDVTQDVEVTPPSGSPFTVIAMQTAISYDPIAKLMLIRNRDLRRSTEAYTVTYKVKIPGLQLNESVKCEQNGRLVVPLSTQPNLDDPFVITGTGNFEVFVDPRQTDAYNFTIPPVQYHGIVKWLYQIIEKLSYVFYYYWVHTPTDHYSEWVPCTIVQCTDPDERKFRVEPNFEDHCREISAAKEEVEGQQAELADDPESLGAVCFSAIDLSQFINWWRSKGLLLMDDGEWINPLTQPAVVEAAGKTAVVNAAKPAFKAYIESEFTKKMQRLNQRLEQAQKWARAYGDMELYSAEAEKSDAEWSLESFETVAELNTRMRTLKAKYEAELDNFKYPMVLDEGVINKQGCLLAQVAKWERVVDSWLREEEGADDVLHKAGSHTLLQATKSELLNVVRKVFNKPEDVDGGVFRSIVHYVAPSCSIRGANRNWHPDPLCAHTGLVLMFDCKKRGEPDMTSPRWMPCALKLTGNAVKILMPNVQDTTRTFPEETEGKPWKQVTGWYVPLEFFEKVDVTDESGNNQLNPPIAHLTNPLVAPLTCQVVFRKNMDRDVDDNVVCRVEDDHEDDTVIFNEGGLQTICCIKAAHTVSKSDADEINNPACDKTREDKDGKVNACPLTIRCHADMLHRWRSTIQAAGMHEQRKPEQQEEANDQQAAYGAYSVGGGGGDPGAGQGEALPVPGGEMSDAAYEPQLLDDGANEGAGGGEPEPVADVPAGDGTGGDETKADENAEVPGTTEVEAAALAEGTPDGTPGETGGEPPADGGAPPAEGETPDGGDTPATDAAPTPEA
eukprot:GHVU01099952.1.p1 GENE.GHVU01099952.1~~GHVU01099952.1.p1  ORF type:complete len:2314 (+),score=443.89 GHVU01099952.1:57-6998(+)